MLDAVANGSASGSAAAPFATPSGVRPQLIKVRVAL
jgi:hypothetical protein